MKTKDKICLFKLQGDVGDEDRLKLNFIQLAAAEGTLERTETKDEIRFRGMFSIKGEAIKI